MSLESLLKPVKWVDEQILRPYTKLTKIWESKGRSRYSLAHIFNLSAIASYCTGVHLYNQNHLEDSSLHMGFLNTLIGLVQGTDLARNIFEKRNKKDVTDKHEKVADDTLMNIYRKITNTIRLPSLLTGVTFMGKGVVEIIDYVKNKNPNSLNNAVFDLTFGYSFIGLASSIYVKAADPKLLEKDPFWAKAYEKIKEKVKSLLPRPMPQPRPVPVRYSTIDNYTSN